MGLASHTPTMCYMTITKTIAFSTIPTGTAAPAPSCSHFNNGMHCGFTDGGISVEPVNGNNQCLWEILQN